VGHGRLELVVDEVEPLVVRRDPVVLDDPVVGRGQVLNGVVPLAKPDDEAAAEVVTTWGRVCILLLAGQDD
jgi:hypothetical protein